MAGRSAGARAVALAGLMPMHLTMDIAHTPSETLQQCRHLQRFFEATDFYTMAPHDELADGGTRWVLAAPGGSYIAYTDKATGSLGLVNLEAGRYHLTWLDCITGKTIVQRKKMKVSGTYTREDPITEDFFQGSENVINRVAQRVVEQMEQPW